MKDDNSPANGGEPPSGRLLQSLKEFRSAGRGFWRDVSDADWNDWHWQLKHRITTPEQLQRLMPMLTPEEFAGAKLSNHKLALAITPYFSISLTRRTNTARFAARSSRASRRPTRHRGK
jgi:lysine 2,3-aminomutase